MVATRLVLHAPVLVAQIHVELVAQAWGNDSLEVGERAVDNVVLRLRKKVGRPELIETVRGIGFRLGRLDDDG